MLRKIPQNFQVDLSSKLEQESFERVKLRAMSLSPSTGGKQKQDEQKAFNFDDYEFFNPNSRFQIDDFKESFIDAKNMTQNQQRMRKLTTQLVYGFVYDMLDKDEFGALIGIPEMFRDNHIRWTNLMIRDQKVQNIMVDFQQRISNIIRKEAAKNKDLLNLYMKQPRKTISPQKDLKEVAPSQERVLGTSRLEHADDLDLYEENPFKYYRPVEERRSVLAKEKVATSDIEKAKEKYNYLKELKDKKDRQARFTGVNKKLNDARGKSAAQAALEAHLKKETEEERKEREEREQIERTKRLFELKQKRKAKARLKMNPFTRHIDEKTEKIENLVEEFESNNIDLRNAVADVEAEFFLLDSKIPHELKHITPGIRVQKMLYMWNKEIYPGDEDIVKWKQEYWKSLEEFEEELEQQQKGFEMAYAILQKRYNSESYRLKHQLLLQESIYKTTIIELKLKLQRDRERAEMFIAEIESTRLNSVAQAKAVEALIQKAEGGLVLRNMHDAKVMIKEFLMIVKSKNIEIESLEKQLTYKSKMVEALEQRIFDKDKLQAEEQRQKKFYQNQILKLVRDLELFENDPDKKAKFEAIYENEDDITYQRQIVLLLESIDLQQVLIDHVNKHYGHIEGLNAIQENLNLIGLARGGEELSSSSESFQSSNMKSSQVRSQQSRRQTIRKLNSKTSRLSHAEESVGAMGIVTPKKRITGEISPVSGVFRAQQTQKQGYQRRVKAILDKRQSIVPQKIQISPGPRYSINSPVPKTSIAHNLEKSYLRQPSQMSSKSMLSRDSQQSKVHRKKKRRKRGDDTHKIHRKVAKKAAQKHVFELIKKAVAGEAEKPKATLESGKPTEDKLYEARENMVQFIKEIDPNEVENLNFLDKKDQKEEEKDTKKGGKQKKQNALGKNMKRFLKQNNVTVIDDQEKEKKDKRIKQEKEKEESKKLIDPQPIIESPHKSATDEESVSGKESLQEEQPQKTKEKTKKPSKSSPQKVAKPAAKSTIPKATTTKKASPKVKGIVMIMEELERMNKAKYQQHVDDAMEEMEYNKQDFKLNSTQIHELQELTQGSMDVQMSYDDYFDLFKPNLGDFFVQFNKQIVKQYEFQDINRHIASKGKYNPEVFLTLQEKQIREEQQQDNIKTVSFGDLIKPVISEKGELMGFQLRTDLAPLLYLNNDYDQQQLQRAVRTVIYMNRLIQDGKYDDFELKQIQDGEQPHKLKSETGIQVDTEDLQQYALHHGTKIELPSDKILRYIRKMAVGIQTRMKPYDLKYETEIWEEKDLNNVMRTRLSNAYKTGAEQRQDVELYVEEVVELIFKYVVNVVQTIPDPDMKEFLIFNRIFLQESFEEREFRLNNKKDVCLMAEPRITHKAIMTGVDLLKNLIRDPSIITNLRNRELLSKALKEEVERTIHILDEIASFVDLNGENAFRKLLKEPVFEQGPPEGRLRNAFNSDRQSEEIEQSSPEEKKPVFQGYPFLIAGSEGSNEFIDKTYSDLRRHNQTAQDLIPKKEFQSKQFILSPSVNQSRDLSATVSRLEEMRSGKSPKQSNMTNRDRARVEMQQLVKRRVNRMINQKGSSPEAKVVVEKLSKFINKQPIDMLGTGYSQHFALGLDPRSTNLTSLQSNKQQIRTQLNIRSELGGNISPAPSSGLKLSEIQQRQLMKVQLNQQSDANPIMAPMRPTEEEIQLSGQPKLIHEIIKSPQQKAAIKVLENKNNSCLNTSEENNSTVTKIKTSMEQSRPRKGSPIDQQSDYLQSINRDIEEGFGSMKEYSRANPLQEADSDFVSIIPDNFIFRKNQVRISGPSPKTGYGKKKNKKRSGVKRNSILNSSTLSGHKRKETLVSTIVDKNSVPSDILSKALKAGKNFKWANEDLKKQYENLQNANIDKVAPSQLIPKNKTGYKYMSEFSSLAPDLSMSPHEQRMSAQSKILNFSKRKDGKEIGSTLTGKQRKRMENLKIGENPKLHVEFGNKLYFDAQVNSSLQGAPANFNQMTLQRMAGRGLFSPKESINPTQLNSMIQQQHSDSEVSRPLDYSIRDTDTANSMLYNQLKQFGFKPQNQRNFAEMMGPLSNQNTHLQSFDRHREETKLKTQANNRLRLSSLDPPKMSLPRERIVSTRQHKFLNPRASLNIKGINYHKRLETVGLAQTPELEELTGQLEQYVDKSPFPPATALPAMSRLEHYKQTKPKEEEKRGLMTVANEGSSRERLHKLEFNSSHSNQEIVPIKHNSEFNVEGWQKY